jgi:arylsulfatase A-like enzyme
VKPLNIVYLHAHDLGRYCQPYGHAIPAPNVQKLAEGGVLFRHAFCLAPTCSPSRAALVTGRWPHGNGMFGLASEKWGYTLNDYSQHLAQFLRRHGYETALAGVQHVARKPWADPEEVLGYDRFLNHTPTPLEIHEPERTAGAAAAFLAEKHERPFFLSAGFLEPHRANRGDRRVFSHTIAEQPADLDARYSAPMPHLPDTAVTRRETANFKMGVEIMDRKMGVVLDAVEENGLAENTLVICTTDHGPGFPEAKCTLTDRGTGVMLIVRGPEGTGFTGGKVSDALVTHMDVYPTVCDLLGLERPEWLQGESLLPLARGERDEVREMVFTEQSYHGQYRPLRAVRTRRYKYIRSFDANSRWGVDRGPAQEMWEEHGYGGGPHPEEELFDLLFDPNEANNLAGRGTHGEVLAEMRSHLGKWMEDTGDPILGEGVPAPPGWQEKS